MEQKELASRIDRLERSNRILGAAVLALLALIVAVGFSQKSNEIPDVVRAHALQIYSPDNKLIVDARYDTWTEGGAVTIFDKNGVRRSWWRAHPGGAHLMMAGSKSPDASKDDLAPSAAMAVDRQFANVQLTGTKTFGWLTASGEKDPAINLYSKDGKTVFTTEKKSAGNKR